MTKNNKNKTDNKATRVAEFLNATKGKVITAEVERTEGNIIKYRLKSISTRPHSATRFTRLLNTKTGKFVAVALNDFRSLKYGKAELTF